MRTQRIDVGFSSAMSGLDMVPRAAGQARLALRHADLAGGGTAKVVAFDDLGQRYKVLDSLRDDQLQELEDAVVGRLLDADRRGHSDLLRTLETYLACGGSAVDAAAELYVHRNTLRKRVARIEEILGVDLGTAGRPRGGVPGGARQGRARHAPGVRRETGSGHRADLETSRARSPTDLAAAP